jgi:hypothetical protein
MATADEQSESRRGEGRERGWGGRAVYIQYE